MVAKKVGIIVFDNAEVLDVMGPFEVFSVAGRISEPSKFQVALISDSKEKSVTLRHGLRILTEKISMRSRSLISLSFQAG